MKKSFVRILSFFLSIILCISIFPTSVFADESTSPVVPTLSNPTLTDGAKLVAQDTDKHDEYDRAVASVTYESYEEWVDKGLSTNKKWHGYSIGKVVLHITEALDSSWDYHLPENTLSLTVTYPDGTEEKDSVSPWGYEIGFAAGQTVSAAKHFGKTTAAVSKADPGTYFYFDVEVVVDEVKPQWDYPVLESLEVSSFGKLCDQEHDKYITVTGVAFRNYEDATVYEDTSTGRKLLAGEVTVYIAGQLDETCLYTLNDLYGHNTLTAGYSPKDGFYSNGTILTGTFDAGKTETVSTRYAINTSTKDQYFYKLKIEVGYPDDGVYLIDGSSTRMSQAQARITFHSNKAGTFYYAVVDASAADAPAMPETGATMSEGTNTFVTSVTDGAKKVYIWGKDSSG